MMEPCSRCGDCCKAETCEIGLTLLGDTSPCRALEQTAGKYACGLIIHASKYLDLGDNVGWKEKILGQWFGEMLGIGKGCGSEDLDWALARGFAAARPWAEVLGA